MTTTPVFGFLIFHLVSKIMRFLKHGNELVMPTNSHTEIRIEQYSLTFRALALRHRETKLFSVSL